MNLQELLPVATSINLPNDFATRILPVGFIIVPAAILAVIGAVSLAKARKRLATVHKEANKTVFAPSDDGSLEMKSLDDKAKDEKSAKDAYNIGVVAIAVAAILLVATCVPMGSALTKGATLSQLVEMPLFEIMDSNKSALTQSTDIPSDIEELKGSIVVIYKYDCNECEAVHDDLQTAIDEARADELTIYAVTSNSDIARELIAEVNPTDSPIAVYVRNNPADLSGLEYNYIAFVNKDSHGNMSFDQDGWDRLVRRQQNAE